MLIASSVRNDAFKTSTYKVNCNHPNDGSEASLCASISQASAAQTSNDISRTALQWNVGGIVLLFLTLAATAWSARSAARAAHVAERATRDAGAALQIAERNASAAEEAVKSDRAWIWVEDLDFGPVQKSTVKEEDGSTWYVKEGLALQINWVNYGRSPAVDVVSMRHYKVINHNDKESSFAFPEVAIDAPKSITAIGRRTPHNPVILSDEQTSLFRSQKCHVMIWAKVEYSDIYSAENPKRISEVAFTVIHQGGMKMRNGRMEEAISFNTADRKGVVT